jgi:uncharacterized protein YutE (UPF0331/DUF86 family)
MVNPEIINERLREIEENLILLDELKSTPFDKFRNDPKIFKLSLHCLQISIQCLLDICHHIIVDNNWPRPKDNREAIEIIARYKIIPQKFAKTLLPMAGLRNILVHEYIKINPSIIYKHLKRLRDFRQFQKYILAYLSRIK